MKYQDNKIAARHAMQRVKTKMVYLRARFALVNEWGLKARDVMMLGDNEVLEILEECVAGEVA